MKTPTFNLPTIAAVSNALFATWTREYPHAEFLFDRRGDLIDCGPQSLRDADGGASVALSHDAYSFANGIVPSYLSR